jgi:sialic acid synthase SpsE
MKVILDLCLNHCGSTTIAKQMIDQAYNLEVYGVKFQYYDVNSLNPESGFNVNYYAKNHLKKEELIHLMQYAKSLDLKTGITLFTNGFPINDSSVDFFKIGSGEAHKIEIYEKLKNKKVFISNGLTPTETIIDNCDKVGLTNKIIFDCISKYPCAISEYRYKHSLATNAGLSLHLSPKDGLNNIDFLLLYRYVEFHYTLSKDLKTKDINVSWTFDDVKELSNGLKDYKERWIW